MSDKNKPAYLSRWEVNELEDTIFSFIQDNWPKWIPRFRRKWVIEYQCFDDDGFIKCFIEVFYWKQRKKTKAYDLILENGLLTKKPK